MKRSVTEASDCGSRVEHDLLWETKAGICEG